jgi:hypothetical protein
MQGSEFMMNPDDATRRTMHQGYKLSRMALESQQKHTFQKL